MVAGIRPGITLLPYVFVDRPDVVSAAATDVWSADSGTWVADTTTWAS